MRKISLFITAILLLGLCSSFSKSTKENNLTLRNIEALYKGEVNPDDDCVSADGKCIIRGVVFPGMTLKEIKR